MLYCRLAHPFLDTSSPINGYRRLYTVCGIISQVLVVYEVDGYERKNYPHPEHTLILSFQALNHHAPHQGQTVSATREIAHHDSSSSNVFASIKSAVSNPSVNHLYTGASRS